MGFRVLILEDLSTDVEITRRELENALGKFSLRVVETEDDFLEALDSFHPDLIISDFKLPVYDGLSALHALRKKYPWIPFIVLTGSMNEDTAVACMKAGADDYLIKDHIRRLGTSVRNTLERKKIEHEHHEALEALRKSEEKYRSLVEGTTDAIIAADTEGRVISWNTGAVNLFGYKAEEIIGKHFGMLCPPELREQQRSKFERAMSAGQVKGYETVRLKKDGTPVPVEITLAVLKETDGTKTGMTAVLRDTTERRESMEALRQSEEKFRLMAENSVDCIWTMDTRLRFTYLSPALEGMTGFKPEQWVGTRLGTHFKKKEFFKVGALAAKAIKEFKTFKPVTFETKMLNSDNEEVEVEVTGKVLLDQNGKLTGLQGTTRDITERRQMELRIQKELKEKELLLRELYHRTKNNMQVISSMLRLRARVIPDEGMRSVFLDIENKIRTMAMVHQRLYQSQNLSHLDLKDYFQDLIMLIRQSYLNDGDRISLVFDAGEVPVLIDTAIPLGLVLNELLLNSVKHAFPGNRKGEIRIRLHVDAKNELRLEVSDNGVGFPEGFDVKTDGRLGLETIESLVGYQLGGTVSFENKNGVKCLIRIKKELYKPRI